MDGMFSFAPPEYAARLDAAAARGAWREVVDLLHRLASESRWPGVKAACMMDCARLLVERFGNEGGALAAAREVLAIDPTWGEARVMLEEIAERRRDWATLAASLRESVRIASDDRTRLTALQRLARLRLHRLGDPEGAEDAARQALAIDPDNFQAREILLYIQAGGNPRGVMEDLGRPSSPAPPAPARDGEPEATRSPDLPDHMPLEPFPEET